MEEMHFVNTYTVTPERLLALSRHPQGKARRQRRVWQIFYWSAGIVMLIFGLLLLLARIWAVALLCLAYLGLCIYRLFFDRRRKLNRHYRLVMQGLSADRWTVALQFGDEEVIYQNGDAVRTFPYTYFVRLTEDDTCFYLWHDDTFIFELPRDSFTVGDPAAFPAFIAEKLTPSVK